MKWKHRSKRIDFNTFLRNSLEKKKKKKYSVCSLFFACHTPLLKQLGPSSFASHQSPVLAGWQWTLHQVTMSVHRAHLIFFQ